MPKQAKRSTSRKAAAKKTARKAVHKSSRKKATRKKAAVKKATRKAAAKTARKKAAARKASPKRAAAKKAASRKKATRARPAAKKAKKAAKRAAPKAAKETPRRPRVVGPRAHSDSGLSRPEVKALHQKLQQERGKVLAELRRSVHGAVDEISPFSESIDQAQHETEQNFRLRLADKQRKLLNEIDTALQKMDTGEFGICEGTEDPIGFRRLEIRPWARYSVEYKEMKDRRDR